MAFHTCQSVVIIIAGHFDKALTCISADDVEEQVRVLIHEVSFM